ncbi:MAG: septal ring lytic transglycosylase RlpA family protein [Candidatus Marinimicrobia bacterium]|nr:septal ring lytic transglycosylase RlpA family protein [Candidatus Neomarinimicrobiota bacterium]MBL7047155.1 septal ring lytic transglycosylase RlpA family protein [Candidatus Neomarinimicrobiota bacterium]
MIRKMILLLSILMIFSCASSPRYAGNKKPHKSKESKTRTRHSNTLIGLASYYAEDFHGKLTANGEVYDMYGLTAAHKTLPLNTIIRVTNLENDKSLILRINDRGPYVKGRILDCSYGAAVKLGFVGMGTTKVKIEVIEYGDDEYMKHRE